MTPEKKEPETNDYAGRFAARLRELRERAKLSQKELAEAVGVKQTAVSKWELGSRFPPPNSLPAIAKALKTSVRNVMPKE